MGTPITWLDNVRITSTTRGTGALQLSVAAAPGYQHPNNAKAQTGTRSGFKIQSQNGLVWELVEGVLTQGTPWSLARVRYVANNTGVVNQPINWQDEHGTLTITAVTLSNRLPALDTDGVLSRALLPDMDTSRFGISSPTSVPSGPAVVVPFNAVAEDNAAGGSGGFQLTEGGIYVAASIISMAASSAGQTRYLGIRYTSPAGATQPIAEDRRTAALNSGMLNCSSVHIPLAAGGLLHVIVQQDSGAAMSFGDGVSYFSLLRLR